MLQFLPLIGKVLDKVLPDPTAKAESKIKMMEMAQAGDFKDIEAALERDVQQIALNKIEAGSSNVFKSGWRPAVGWICAFGLLYATILHPLLSWAAVVFDILPPPNLGVDVLMPVLLGMLGLGGMRSFEKFKGLTK